MLPAGVLRQGGCPDVPAWAVGWGCGAATVEDPWGGTSVSRVAVWQPPAPAVLCSLEILFCTKVHPGLGGLSTLQMGDEALQVGHEFQSWKGFNWAHTLF